MPSTLRWGSTRISRRLPSENVSSVSEAILSHTVDTPWPNMALKPLTVAVMGNRTALHLMWRTIHLSLFYRRYDVFIFKYIYLKVI